MLSCMALFEVKNINYSYDRKDCILNDVSFDINEGEFVSIIGHNGSGKSTLAKILVGLLKPSNGTIVFDGEIINEKNKSVIRNNVCLVFQNPDNQFIGSTVEDDIAFGLENHRVPQSEMKDIIYKYAEAVGMKEYLTKEPQMLSGGQKQRVAIAGALALNPKVLILDESTSMLDPKGKSDIIDLIQSLKTKDNNITVIRITHDVEEAMLSDKIVVLNKGHVEKIGTPIEIFTDNELLNKIHISKPFAIDLKEKLGIENCELNLDSLLEAICQSK